MAPDLADIDELVAGSGVVDPGSRNQFARGARAEVPATPGGSLSDDEAAAIAEGFKVLGDPTRTRILYALREAGELCVGDLAATVGVAQPAVSQGLRVLRAARVVKVRRAGRMSFYSLSDDHVRELLDLSLEHHRHQPGTAP